MTAAQTLAARFEGPEMTEAQMVAQERKNSGPFKEDQKIIDRDLDQESEDHIRDS
jgi:hypothetical protein